jgi:hypothetical protein
MLLPVRLSAQLPVGKWRTHFSYLSAKTLCDAGDRIYCAGANGLFYYDLDDYTVNPVDKTNQLSDVGISTFAYDHVTKCLVVAYNNANVDIIKNGKTFNLSDIKRSNIGGNKKINSIRFDNRYAYLACGFGIVVVDLTRNEIKDTYLLGENSSYANINDVAFTDSLIVAATDDGIMTAYRNSPILHIVSSWRHDTASLAAGQTITRLGVDASSRLHLLAFSAGSDTTIYRDNGNLAFAPITSGNIKSFRFYNGCLLACHADHVDIYRPDGTLQHSIAQADWMPMTVNDAITTTDGRLWLAHSWAGMACINPDNPSSVATFHPECPPNDDVYRLTAFDKKLMVSPGGHRTTYAGVYNAANVFTMDGDSWYALVDEKGILDNIRDIIDVAVNPSKQSTFMAAAWGGGIVEVTDNKVVQLYDATTTNGVLEPYVEGSYSTLLTGGLAYDGKGNLWVTNSLKTNGLAVRYSNGNWASFSTQSMVGNNDIDHLIWDSINDLKIFWGRANRIFVHDGNDKMAYIDPNNGAKLETSMVNCVAQDHQGNLWIGTNKGIKVIYSLNSIFDNGGGGERSPVTCNNILFSANGITEYLMAYESITSIVVDGANRKWVGTSTGGLYLLSANGLEQIEHFTAANSPLLSDKVLCLAIMPWSGELFVGTTSGLVSYRTTATYAFAEPMEDIHAYPNPVRPGYDGLIAIKGFARNALVHITDANGNTVFATRANGGQAVWNGCTHDGKKVASGVYYVFASADDGSMRSATKILIIR